MGRQWYCWVGRWYVSIMLSVVQTIVVSGTVWPQFVIHVSTQNCKPPVCGEWVVILVRDRSMNNPVVTSYYRFLIVTIGLSITIFVMLRLVRNRCSDRQTGGRNWSKQKAANCVHCTLFQKMAPFLF